MSVLDKYYSIHCNNSRKKRALFLFCIFFSFLFLSGQSYAQEVMFKATFESNSLEADVGKYFAQSNDYGELRVVPNPFPDNNNSSAYVLKASLMESTTARAEYSNATISRYPTEGETHIYTWKRYYPQGMFDDINLIWLLVGQWKTWPCERNKGYSDVICSGGGIFNDIDFKDRQNEKFRFRAVPDCNVISVEIEEDSWEEFTIVIYWTKSNEGYYQLFKNKELIGGESNIKTLYDRFPDDHSCDIYFTLGLYSGWSSETKDTISYYIDDFAVYKVNNKSELKSICPDCATQLTTSLNEYNHHKEIFELHLNPLESYVNLLLKEDSTVSIYDTAGKLVSKEDHTPGMNIVDINGCSGIVF